MEGGMTDWVIEDGIPIPPKDTSRLTAVKGSPTDLNMAFVNLRVGQSLFSKTIDRYTLTNRYSRVSHIHGHHFTSRKMDGGVRVWRVE